MSMNPVRPVRLLPQVGIISLAVLAYFLVRGATDSAFSTALRNAHRVIDLERVLHLYHEPYLQEALAGSAHVRGFFNGIYIYGHWPVIITVLVWLARRHPAVYFRTRDAMLLSGGIGLVVFTLFPLAPPRLSGLGMADTLVAESYRVLQPTLFTNQYAAMPSLHCGWNLLMAFAVMSAARHPLLKCAGAVMPAFMVVTVILTANHFLVDVIAGAALCTACWLITGRRTGTPGSGGPGLSRRLRRPWRGVAVTLPAARDHRSDEPVAVPVGFPQTGP
jgi:hypothetical protein